MASSILKKNDCNQTTVRVSICGNVFERVAVVNKEEWRS